MREEDVKIQFVFLSVRVTTGDKNRYTGIVNLNMGDSERVVLGRVPIEKVLIGKEIEWIDSPRYGEKEATVGSVIDRKS
jgi:hypothetical protein